MNSKMVPLIFSLSIIFSMNGLELARLMESRLKPNDVKSINTMRLTNKDNKVKILELISISKDDSEKQMIWFLKPAKDKGTAFLKIEHDAEDDFMSIWLPGFSRFKRIKSNQTSDSFMGSDLSFEDLTNRTISDYDYNIKSMNNEKSGDWYELESIPKDIASEYSKHITKVKEIEPGIFLSFEEYSYDKENKLLKTKIITFKKISSYYIMDKLEVKNVQKKHSTLLTVNDISLNNGFKDEKFVQRSLKTLP